MGEPAVSIVVPTLGRPEPLADMLAATARCACPPGRFEILVSDTGGLPETRELCEKVAAAGVPLRQIVCPSRALHAGRHWGALHARADVLLFADDDVVPSEFWIEAMAAAFADPRVAMAGGACLPEYGSPPPSWVERLWRPCEGGRTLGQFSLIERAGPTRPTSPYEVYGCNFAIRKSVLADAGGFHPDGVPPAFLRYRGDGETAVSAYVLENGLKCLHVADASVRHRVAAERLTAAYLYRRSFAQGVSDSYSKVRRNGRTDWVPGAVRAWDWVAGVRRTDDLPDVPPRRLPGQVADVVALGHERGVEFHQREVRRDSALLQWVLRGNYWDVGLPGE